MLWRRYLGLGSPILLTSPSKYGQFHQLKENTLANNLGKIHQLCKCISICCYVPDLYQESIVFISQISRYFSCPLLAGDSEEALESTAALSLLPWFCHTVVTSAARRHHRQI